MTAQIDFVCELLGVRDPKHISSGRPRERRKLENALKGVNVEVTHRKCNRQVSMSRRTFLFLACVQLALCFCSLRTYRTRYVSFFFFVRQPNAGELLLSATYLVGQKPCVFVFVCL